MLISALFLAAAASAAGQSETASPCPKFEITGPSGVTYPGDTMTFIANVGNNEAPNNYKYNWVVSAGTIESGLGTPSIVVRSKSDYCKKNYTATVEIEGLPAGCSGTRSETAIVQRPGNPTKVDSYERIPFSKEKIRLRAAVKDVKSAGNRKLVLVLVLYRTNKDSLIAVKKRSKNISRFLRTTGLDDKGFHIVLAETATYSTQIYLVPSDRCDDADDRPRKNGHP